MAHHGSEIEDLKRSILNDLIPAGTDDDVALLLIRCLPTPLEDTAPHPTNQTPAKEVLVPEL